MRIKKLRNKLYNEINEFQMIRNIKFVKKNEKEPIIIGVTGSRGKSSVAYILHYYLKSLGYSSVLYSSIEIDSELSYVKKHFAVDNPLKSKKTLLSAVDQCINQNADFLILEVNERAIKLGLINDIEFDVKVLTNIIEKQNEVFYEDYVELKKNFIKTANKNEKLVYVVKDEFCKDLVNELCNYNQTVISTPFLINRYKLNPNNINCVISSDKSIDSINGVEFLLNLNKKDYKIKTKIMFSYSCFNLACVIAVLDYLKLFNIDKFNKLIDSIVIPGRDEIIKYKNRKIIISVNLVPQLEEIYKYKSLGQINDLIVVTGATGLGFKGWKNEFSKQLIDKDKELAMKFAYDYINKYADKVVITITDVGNTNIEELFSKQNSLLKPDMKKEFFKDRYEAIKFALSNSNENDIIFISGRGNREILCNSIDKIILSKDIDLIHNIINKEVNNEISV